MVTAAAITKPTPAMPPAMVKITGQPSDTPNTINTSDTSHATSIPAAPASTAAISETISGCRRPRFLLLLNASPIISMIAAIAVSPNTVHGTIPRTSDNSMNVFQTEFFILHPRAPGSSPCKLTQH